MNTTMDAVVFEAFLARGLCSGEKEGEQACIVAAAYTAYAASSAASYAAAATLRISVTCAIEAIEYARETM